VDCSDDLRNGTTRPVRPWPRVRLLLLCDGLHELRLDSDAGGSVSTLASSPLDLACTLHTEMVDYVRSPLWPKTSLRIVVTSNEAALGDPTSSLALLGQHSTRALLPLTGQQVGMHGFPGRCCHLRSRRRKCDCVRPRSQVVERCRQRACACVSRPTSSLGVN
jgi:hypothetical protein